MNLKYSVGFDADFAVKGFFAISGFLVTQSYLSSRSIKEYAEKRIRRIYPAYVCAVLLCFLIGVISTHLRFDEFIQSPSTIKYLIANLTFLNFIQPSLPSVFESNISNSLNGSLWTIKVEVMLYFCVPILVWLFRKFDASKMILVIYILSICWVYFFTSVYNAEVGKEIARQFPGQISYFGLGAFFAVNEKSRGYIAYLGLFAWAMLLLLNNPIVKVVFQPLAYATLVIYLATAAKRSFNLGRYGDISYGIYLYHFPFIQLLFDQGIFKNHVWLGFSLTFAITLLLAWLSWHLVEKRILKRNSHYILATQG